MTAVVEDTSAPLCTCSAACVSKKSFGVVGGGVAQADSADYPHVSKQIRVQFSMCVCVWVGVCVCRCPVKTVCVTIEAVLEILIYGTV